MQKAHAHHIAVKIAGPVHNESLHRSFSSLFERWPRADVGYTSAPLTINQSRRDVHATVRNHTILGMKISRGKSQFDAARSAAKHPALNPISPSQHAPRQIHAALLEQFTNST